MNKGILIFLTVLASACGLFLTATIIWGLNRGFDLTDEGLYMFYLQQLFGDRVGPIEARMLRILGTLTATGILTAGVHRWFTSLSLLAGTKLEAALVYSFLLCSTFISYTFGPPSLSYNSIVLILGESYTGLLLLTFLSRKTLSANISAILCGFVACVVFYVKFLTGIILLFIPIAAMLLVSRFSREMIKDLGRKITIVALGGALGILVITLIGPSLADYFENIAVMAQIGAEDGHTLKNLIAGFYYALIGTLDQTFVQNPFYVGVLIAISSSLLIAFNGSTAMKVKSRTPLVIAGLVTCTLVILDNSWYLGGVKFFRESLNPHLLLIVFVVLLPLGAYGWRHRKALKSQPRAKLTGWILLYLLVLPFLLSFGTNVQITAHMIQYLFSWHVVFLFAFLFLIKKYPLPAVPAALAITVLLCASQAWYGFVMDPYRLHSPLTEMQAKIKTPQGNELFIDDDLSMHMSSLTHILNTNLEMSQEGIHIITMQTSPGIPYLLDKETFRAGWFRLDNPIRNCLILNSKPDFDRTKVILTMPHYGQPSPKFQACLTENGLSFPDQFIELGRIKNYPDSNYDIKVFATPGLLKK